jgi:chorismate synthase
VAEKWLYDRFGIEIIAWVSAVGSEEISEDEINLQTISREEVDDNVPLRCGTKEAFERMSNVIHAARDDHDSIGGCVTCVARGIPAGWGEPCFDKLEAGCAFFDRNLHSRSAIWFHAFAPLEALPCA